MKILAIETSCDDTGVAVLEVPKKKRNDFSAQGGPASGWKILSNIVSSQIKVHKKYGGVYPAMAKREHQNNLVPTFKKALEEAGMLKIFNLQFSIFNEFSMIKFSNVKKILDRERELCEKLIPFLKKYEKPDIDLITVTNGPGLEPCLWVGVNFAKALSYFWDIPVVAVNHIESHILVNFLKDKNIKFPAIALVVSGGHTQLILMKGIRKYKILGETRDDAAGECFDKCAKILGLGYPGGPAIAKLADVGRLLASRRPTSASIQLPRPMINTKDYDFSFSGLKTAVLYQVKKDITTNPSVVLSKKYKAQMANEIQQAIIDVLIKKTIKAAKDYNAKSIILGGGVSANYELRRQIQQALNSKGSTALTPSALLIPPENLSTDNAVMTAIAGYFHRNKRIATSDVAILRAKANLRIK